MTVSIPRLGRVDRKLGGYSIDIEELEVSIPRLGRVDRKTLPMFTAHHRLLVESPFPSPDWGELIERWKTMPNDYGRLSTSTCFHPQIGESWSKEELQEGLKNLLPELFPSPGWGELIERWMTFWRICLSNTPSCFHPQVGESWSKAERARRICKNCRKLFPSPGWGELIESRARSFLFYLAISCFHPQVGESWSKEQAVEGVPRMFIKMFPSPGWGELIESVSGSKRNWCQCWFPSPGWGELIERSDASNLGWTVLWRFHPQVGESWSKDVDKIYDLWLVSQGKKFPSPGWGELIERTAKTHRGLPRSRQGFHPQVGESWSKVCKQMKLEE